MKRIIVAFTIVFAITLMTLSLQSCFIPYHDRDGRGDRREEPGDHREGPGEHRGGPEGPGGPPPHPPLPPHP